jgi:alpha-L-fucosidase
MILVRRTALRAVHTLRRVLLTREAWLLPLIIAAAAYHPLTSKGRLTIGPVAIEPTDIGIGLAILAALVLAIRRGRPKRLRSGQLLVAGIIVLLFAPVFVGMADGHTWQSSFYSARAPFALLVFFATWELVRDVTAAVRVLTYVLVMALVGAFVGAFAHVVGWQWSNAMSVVITESSGVLSRGYGWWSAMPWYVYGAVVAVTYALLAQSTRRRRCLAWAAAALLAFSTVSTLIRGDLLGLLAGTACVAALVLGAAPRGGLLRRRLRTAVIVSACVIAGAAGVAALAKPSDVALLGERTVSIFLPRTSSNMAQATRSDRIIAAQYGIEAALRKPLGSGYGDTTSVPTVVESRVHYFSTHSGIAWLGIYLGLAGSLVFVATALALALLAVRNARRSIGTTWVAAASLGVLAAMVAQSVGTSVLFATHYTYPLAAIALAIALKPLPANAGSPLQDPEREGRLSLLQRLRKAIAGKIPGLPPSARVATMLVRFLVACCIAMLVLSAGLFVTARLENHGLFSGLIAGPGKGLIVTPGEGTVKPKGTIALLTNFSVNTETWDFRSNGVVSFDALFMDPGTYLVTVDASGTALDGVGPALMLRLDGGPWPPVHFVGTQWSSYDWVISATEGIHRIEVAYTNDAVSPSGGDRNCSINRIQVRPLSSAAAPTIPLDDPFWKSLASREKPIWFGNAKFGIFVHWGVYSVPAWAPKNGYGLSEWYSYLLATKNPDVVKHQIDTYGPNSSYSDFAKKFTAARFFPEQWASLFRRAGARYVVLTAKHIDGFALWPAPASGGWNSSAVGPRRDLVGELAKAVRKQRLHFGVYYALAEPLNQRLKTDPGGYTKDIMEPQLRSLVSRYHPAVLWADAPWVSVGQGEHTSVQPLWSSEMHTEDFLKWALARDPRMFVDDRWGTDVVGRGGDFLTNESYSFDKVPTNGRLWESERTIGTSYGYKKNDHYLKPVDYIKFLIDVASHGGNLLLNVGPTAQGTIPAPMKRILVAMGTWLKANGPSIYGTRAGPIQDPAWYRTTQRPGRMYVFLYGWPKQHVLRVNLTGYFLTQPRILSTGQVLPTDKRRVGSLTITLPKSPPADSVPVIQITVRKVLHPSEH